MATGRQRKDTGGGESGREEEARRQDTSKVSGVRGRAEPEGKASAGEKPKRGRGSQGADAGQPETASPAAQEQPASEGRAGGGRSRRTSAQGGTKEAEGRSAGAGAGSAPQADDWVSSRGGHQGTGEVY